MRNIVTNRLEIKDTGRDNVQVEDVITPEFAGLWPKQAERQLVWVKDNSELCPVCVERAIIKIWHEKKCRACRGG